MQAVLAFSDAILAWDNGSEETRSIGANYSTSAHSALQEASSNPDAMLAALILLSWVETSWYVRYTFSYLNPFVNIFCVGTAGHVLVELLIGYVVLEYRTIEITV